MKKRLFLINFISNAKKVLIKVILVTVQILCYCIKYQVYIEPKMWYRYSPGQPKGPNHETK